jgi:hypothetical protein
LGAITNQTRIARWCPLYRLMGVYSNEVLWLCYDSAPACI